MSQLSFRKSQRLSSEDDFQRVLSGKSFVCKGFLRLYRAENEIGSPRFGLSVSKSCGSAVVRNRLKRLAREVFRLHQHEIPAGFDYILIFTNKKPKIKSADSGKMEIPTYVVDYKAVEADILKMVEMLQNRNRIR